MEISFQKHQAAGNDFIVIDNRLNVFSKDIEKIKKLCDRKFGIGSDGLILIENSNIGEFEMVFYNPDGSQSLCGNGCRAAIRFAESLSLTTESTSFNAFDGLHKAVIKGKTINLQMANVQNGREIEGGIFLDTGSPHFVLFVDNVQQIDVINEGRKWRNSGLFGQGGANINFVEILDATHLFVRTYERGVENETLSCGTGITAAALASFSKGCISPLKIKTKGGALVVSFETTESGYKNVWLEGAAEHVFSGKIHL
ncbi:MAG: diaminopimelate epimerase [Cyclobacteriaceae bacterium]|nr:diaminopimelate epimerase [Cyclobacteriaceae bacterium]